jgi:hypothetical protein
MRFEEQDLRFTEEDAGRKKKRTPKDYHLPEEIRINRPDYEFWWDPKRKESSISRCWYSSCGFF